MVFVGVCWVRVVSWWARVGVCCVRVVVYVCSCWSGGGGGAGSSLVGKAGGSGVVIIKEPAIVNLQNTSGMWNMKAVYTAVANSNWTS